MNCISENGSIAILICSSLLEIHSKVFMDGKVGLLLLKASYYKALAY